MSQPPNHWEVFALRYATIGRRRLEMFINHDLHDGPQAMDYFVWLLRRGDDLILIVNFAWTGTFLGLVSLVLMQALVRKAVGARERPSPADPLMPLPVHAHPAGARSCRSIR